MHRCMHAWKRERDRGRAKDRTQLLSLASQMKMNCDSIIVFFLLSLSPLVCPSLSRYIFFPPPPPPPLACMHEFHRPAKTRFPPPPLDVALLEIPSSVACAFPRPASSTCRHCRPVTPVYPSPLTAGAEMGRSQRTDGERKKENLVKSAQELIQAKI